MNAIVKKTLLPTILGAAMVIPAEAAYRARLVQTAPGTRARVQVTKPDSKTILFSFFIPKARNGRNGADGAVGPAGPVGPAGGAGPAGAVGPQGPKGDTGDSGPVTSSLISNGKPFGQPTVFGDPVVDFPDSGGLVIVRDGTDGGLYLRTGSTANTTDVIVSVFATTYVAGTPTVVRNFRVPGNLFGPSTNVATLLSNAENAATVKIVIGNPEEKGAQSTLELQREQNTSRYTGKLLEQPAQP